MKNTIRQLLWGKDNRFNGLIALGILSLIVLGCNCESLNELSKQGSNTSSSNTSSTSNTAAAPKKDATYTKADASKKEIPSEAEMQDLIKTTLLDFNEGLQSEDFTSFYGKINKLWQRQTNPVKLKESFQRLIDGEADLTPISSLDATYTSSPQIIKNLGMNMLDVKGKYATTPIETTFELQYAAEGKDWKLTSIQVYTGVKRN